MQRAQILLEKWQYDTLKSLSEKRGISLSNLVREAVEVYLRQGERRRAPALQEIEGIGSDAAASGRRHDDFLYPAPKSR
jgi:hypothetical protein